MESSEGAAPALAPGRVVGGKFRLERIVGQGGIGAVWQATNTKTASSVALKFLKADDGGEQSRRRLLREARAAAAVQHANVRTVYDIIELEDGSPVLVMEYLNGTSLADRLVLGALSVEDTATVIVQVASGVGAAHAAGLIHRDLKPQNVFLVGGSLEAVKVVDFGIAKWRHGATNAAETVETASGAIVGTPHYMSPEQVFGERTIDHRTDVWSLGLVMIECLSGSLPTRAENVGQVMKIIVSAPLHEAVARIDGLPGDLAALLRRMLSRTPAERPSSMADIMEQLEGYSRVRAPAFGAPRISAEDVVPASRTDTEVERSARAQQTTLLEDHAGPTERAGRRTWLYAALTLAGAASVAALAASSLAGAPAAPAAPRSTSDALEPSPLAPVSATPSSAPLPTAAASIAIDPVAPPGSASSKISSGTPAARGATTPRSPSAGSSAPSGAPSAFTPSQKFE